MSSTSLLKLKNLLTLRGYKLTRQEEAEELIKHYQKVFRMMDWIMTITVHDDPEKFERFGLGTHYPNDQEVKYQVINPDKVPEKWEGVKDMEVTIVHEILHTRFFYCFKPKKRHNHHQEMAIETTAKVIVAARRGITPEELV